VPIRASYGGEKSNLRIGRIMLPFLLKHMRNFFKRLFYRYYLRDVNIGSLELMVGLVLLLFGLVFGVREWVAAAYAGVTATAGTVMLAGLPILVGVQLILGFFAFDVTAVPKIPLQVILGPRARLRRKDEAQVLENKRRENETPKLFGNDEREAG